MQPNEQKRISAVKRFQDIEFDLDENIQDLLKLVTYIYDTPVAFITLIGENDQWFKANRGFDVRRMPRDTSFCTHVIKTQDVMVISDAKNDSRFVNNPLVQQQPYIRFYAGAPLTTADGLKAGTLCVMDTCVKEISNDKKQLLATLSRQAIHLMELKLTYKLLNEKVQQIEHQNKVLKDIVFVQSHEFRGPLTSIMGLMNLIKDEGHGTDGEYLTLMEQAVYKLDEKIHKVVRSTEMAKEAYVR